ncbi:hypothetical protein VP01_459g3 [Puccinia sorghi]|uniref:Uncharacterized protein n=1 Tax=Puccinia sorghi TaxID=27349 RepID=A0A0L6UNI5_9BASI|nr:hypothetical protein VP01_459g3 [Puccinia sorghi]
MPFSPDVNEDLPDGDHKSNSSTVYSDAQPPPDQPGFTFVPVEQPEPKAIPSSINPAKIVSTKHQARLANNLLTSEPFYKDIFAMYAASINFQPSAADPCLFVSRDPSWSVSL